MVCLESGINSNTQSFKFPFKDILRQEKYNLTIKLLEWCGVCYNRVQILLIFIPTAFVRGQIFSSYYMYPFKGIYEKELLSYNNYLRISYFSF